MTSLTTNTFVTLDVSIEGFTRFSCKSLQAVKKFRAAKVAKSCLGATINTTDNIFDEDSGQ